jgi:hypothetical protein
MELARGLEPPTCGLQNLSEPESDTSSNAPPNKEPDDLEEKSE